RPVRELWMHLYLNAFKNQASVFMREPVGGFRGSVLPKEWGTIDVRSLRFEGEELSAKIETKRPGDDDETDARVPLPREVKPGETITLDVVWDDKLPSVVERTGFDGSFHMVAQWFPKIARLEPDGTWAHFPFHHLAEFYADYGSYDVTLDAPASFAIGATGPAIESHVENGRRFEHHRQDDIHDFAWTAWDKFRTRKERIGKVDVTILYPPSYDAIAERELATMRFALPHYGERYGAYPYDVLTLVHPPSTAREAGGMEYPTLITTGGALVESAIARLPELVTIHEFGHQYFYGLLASNEMKWPFLDEGLNSYAEALAMREWKGPGSASELFGLSIGDTEAHAERARHFTYDDRVAQPAHTFGTGGAYGGLVYSRTATILETMRRVYGDAEVGRAMGVYARRFRFEHPTPSDLVETFHWELGAQPADNLRAALFDKGWVDYTVTQMSSHPVHAAAGIFDVAGKRETVKADEGKSSKHGGWVLVTRRGTLTFPVVVELVAEDGTRTRVDWDGNGESNRIPYSGSSPLRSAIVDPDSRILLDQDPTNDWMTASGESGGGAPRVHERLTWWAEVVLGALSP
ncbi:MAG TPA: M1 family metallopeptidase, partial [Labilithrix sp.]